MTELIRKFDAFPERAGEKALFVYVYNEHPPENVQPETDNVTVLLQKGIPPVRDLLSLREEREIGDGRIVVVLDDALALFQNAGPQINKDYTAVVTEYGRRNFTLFVVVQVFCARDFIVYRNDNI